MSPWSAVKNAPLGNNTPSSGIYGSRSPALADKVSNAVPVAEPSLKVKFPAPAKTPCIPLILVLPPKIIDSKSPAPPKTPAEVLVPTAPLAAMFVIVL